MFDESQCDFCGECLVRCPELHLSEPEAKAEMQRLVQSRELPSTLTRCSSCFSCNSYCPQDCNPYDLILSRWNERYQRVGSPPVWKFLCPNQTSNLWSTLHAILPESARTTVEEWMTAEPSETIFLPGSFFHLIPEVLSGSRLLKGVTVMDLPGHWECGAYLYQGGYLDVVRRIGAMVREDLDRWGVKRIIAGLDSVHVMLTNVHPKENGILFEQDVLDFHEWILEEIQDGRLRLDRKLDRAVTVHDNCYAKVGGNQYFDQARRLLDLAGVEVEEMRHHRADALCCGFGRGASWSSNFRIPFDILEGAAARIREAEDTGTDTLVTYCAGCFWLLLAAGELVESRVRIVHLIELVREAMGEEVAFPRRDRAWDILAAMTHQIGQGMGRKHFWIRDVAARMDPSEWRARPQPAIRALRKGLNTELGRRAFRSSFSSLKRISR
jgi:Fe-S oxidoreductase